MKYFIIYGLATYMQRGKRVYDDCTAMYSKGNDIGEMLNNAYKSSPQFMSGFEAVHWFELDEEQVENTLALGYKFADGTE